MARLLLHLSVTVALVLFSASISQAAECVDDPNECTLKALCERATSLDAGSTIWSSAAKHVTLAQQLGMDCGVTVVVDPCDTDPAECKVSQICERATTKKAGQAEWNSQAPGHVNLAKEYGLKCDVNDSDLDEGYKTCSISNLKSCTEQLLCNSATYKWPTKPDGTLFDTSKTYWKSFTGPKKEYVLEAKRRGLTCGVELPVKKECSSSDASGCTTKELCRTATYTSYKNTTAGQQRWWDLAAKSYKEYVLEAKRRGLTCGVGETSKSDLIRAASQRICSSSGRGHICSDIYTNHVGNKWIGRRLNNKLFGVTTLLLLEDDRWNGDVRIGQRDHIKDEWSGQSLYVWRNGNARFDFDVPNEVFNSNSNVNKVFPELRRMFNALPKKERLYIQTSLKNKNLYGSTVDGAWGRNTLVGLSRFAAEHLNSINLKSEKNIQLVFKGALAQVASLQTKMAPLSVLDNVANADDELRQVASRTMEFKKSFSSQSPLYRKQIQYALKKLGYYSSTIDGFWGKGTSAAIITYVKTYNLNDKSTAGVFRNIVDQVNVPTSFAVPKKKNIRPSKEKSGWRSFNSNPRYSLNQAKAICEPQANMAGEQASQSYRSPNYGSTANCRGYGSSINCDVYENSGGIWGGIADGLGQGMARGSAKRAAMASCMAKYGWTKK